METVGDGVGTGEIVGGSVAGLTPGPKMPPVPGRDPPLPGTPATSGSDPEAAGSDPETRGIPPASGTLFVPLKKSVRAGSGGHTARSTYNKSSVTSSSSSSCARTQLYGDLNPNVISSSTSKTLVMVIPFDAFLRDCEESERRVHFCTVESGAVFPIRWRGRNKKLLAIARTNKYRTNRAGW